MTDGSFVKCLVCAGHPRRRKRRKPAAIPRTESHPHLVAHGRGPQISTRTETGKRRKRRGKTERRKTKSAKTGIGTRTRARTNTAARLTKSDSPKIEDPAKVPKSLPPHPATPSHASPLQKLPAPKPTRRPKSFLQYQKLSTVQAQAPAPVLKMRMRRMVCQISRKNRLTVTLMKCLPVYLTVMMVVTQRTQSRNRHLLTLNSPQVDDCSKR